MGAKFAQKALISTVCALAAASLPLSLAHGERNRPKAGLSIEEVIGADKTHTSSVVRASTPKQDRLSSAGLETLKSGLDALSRDDYPTAKAARDRLNAGSLDHKILSWAIASSGSKHVSSIEIANAAGITAGWPNAERLRANSERALARENPPARDVIAAFGDSQPQTADGVIALARALVASGKKTSARSVLEPFWRETKLDAADERIIIREFGGLIRKSVHRYRMERMLYDKRITSAERVRSLAGATSLHKAYAAVERNQKNAKKLLGAVPSSQRGAAYDFAYLRYLRRTDQFRSAAKKFRKIKYDHSKLVDPGEWWFERRVLSRELLDQGDAKLAYQVAASHNARRAKDIADAEFHAGWYALRALNDPKTAHKHFSKIVEIADGPISNARGYYWLGRAAKAGGPGKWKDYYARAANYPTAFYGQIAAAELGRKISIAYPSPSQSDRQNFEHYEQVAAIKRLQAAGHQSRARPFFFEMAKKLNDTGELAMLAVLAENNGDHFSALKVGKIAASRGVDVGALSHPLGAIPTRAKIPARKKALAYAIARQESEFNTDAVSGAGARGLLQLMPGTAREMARKTGLSYSKAKLTRDSAFNAVLGAAYLGEQLDRFDGSYVLTFAGYNAGPRRASDWAKRYGDPRGKSVEAVIDWIERIPFTETRHYVQRVMENMQVYKVRLSGDLEILQDLRR